MTAPLNLCLLLAVTISATPAWSQKLVDPSKVAPEYREAAERRRAEQLRERECALKADLAKTLPRDRIAFINSCIQAAGGK